MRADYFRFSLILLLLPRRLHAAPRCSLRRSAAMLLPPCFRVLMLRECGCRDVFFRDAAIILLHRRYAAPPPLPIFTITLACCRAMPPCC